MSQKQINAAFKKHRASLSLVCKQCQSSHRRRGFYLRRPDKAAPSGPETLTKLQVVSAMYTYLMTSWEELPDKNKRALGFDFVVGSEGEEAALNHLARLFMEYADLSFRRALVARRRRLGLGAYSDSHLPVD